MSDHEQKPANPPRRNWLRTSASIGLAMAAGPVAAQAIQTGFDGLQAGEVDLPTGADSVPAYTARPAKASGPLPVILVVSEIFGVHEYIADVCRRFAKAGYLAIAPEFFYRVGDPGSLATIAEIQSQIVSRTPDASVQTDIGHALDWAVANGGDEKRMGITGFCWGGRVTWLACATHPRLRAGVAWYGRLTGDRNDRFPRHPVDAVTDLKAPVLGLYGGADTGIPLGDVERMQGLLSASTNGIARQSRIRVFADAPHAFHADYRATYREGAAREAWSDALQWFSKQMG